MEANYHSLLRKFALLTVFAGLTTVMLVAQTTVTGVVTDAENGEPLIGANIIIRGSSIGTITDIDGNYSILAAPEDILIFSYTGYSSQEIPVGEQTSIDIQLSAGELLEEIVVIGYGTAKRKDLTGSVALIGNEDFNQGVVVSADQLIQGRTAGVQIVNNSGQPGGATTVRIRGNTSIRLSGGPVYVLDGVP